LTLGEAPSLSDDLGDRLVEGPIPLKVTDELTITDGLKRRYVGRDTSPEQSSDLLPPPGLHHPSHPACDLIV